MIRRSPDSKRESRAFLDAYTAEFVEREMYAYAVLFTDIDDAGHNLTMSLRHAIGCNTAD